MPTISIKFLDQQGKLFDMNADLAALQTLKDEEAFTNFIKMLETTTSKKISNVSIHGVLLSKDNIKELITESKVLGNNQGYIRVIYEKEAKEPKESKETVPSSFSQEDIDMLGGGKKKVKKSTTKKSTSKKSSKKSSKKPLKKSSKKVLKKMGGAKKKVVSKKSSKKSPKKSSKKTSKKSSKKTSKKTSKK